MVERKTCSWHRYRLPKRMIFVSNTFIWREKFILGVFLLLKFMKKKIWAWVDFGFWDGFLRSYIDLSRFLRYFGLKLGWKTSFGVKKLKSWFSGHHNLGKLDDVLPDFFFQKTFGRNKKKGPGHTCPDKIGQAPGPSASGLCFFFYILLYSFFSKFF
jgi:hypothetical protein